MSYSYRRTGMNPSYVRSMQQSSALLPTQTTMNPSAPTSATYYDPADFAYVMENTGTGALRLFTSSGDLGSSWALDTTHFVHHDQTSRYLGVFRVVGTKNFRTAVSTGQVPDRKLPHWVFK